MNASMSHPGAGGRSAAEQREPQNSQSQLDAYQLEPADSNHELVVHRFLVDVLGGGKVSQLSELIAPNYVAHLGHGDYYGPEGVLIDVNTYRTAFPDLTVQIDDLFTCDDQVVRRFTIHGTHTAPFLGRLPTHAQVTLRGIGIDRVVDGRIHESWVLVEFAPRSPPALA